MLRLLQKRTVPREESGATWLELFFDLIYVAILVELGNRIPVWFARIKADVVEVMKRGGLDEVIPAEYFYPIVQTRVDAYLAAAKKLEVHSYGRP